jgi:carboxypeptidase family protein/all-beta uncharacterized protein
MSARIARWIVAVAIAVVGAACESTHAPTTPTPTPTVQPKITITSISVTSERRTTGYAYAAVVHLREDGGAAATISSVDLAFLSGVGTVVSSHHDQPVAGDGSVCPASGTAATKQLMTIDADPSHPIASNVQVTVRYTDGASFVGSANGTAPVPPVGEPPPAQTYSLTGVITDVSTHAGIQGARLEVLSGANAGKSAVADASGTYVIDQLVADSFRLRASASGYDAGEQGVAVPANARADFELRRTAPASCAYAVAPSGAVSVGFVAGQLTVTITRTSGACAWQAASNVAWITTSSSGGDGSATLIASYQSNASFVGRTGTLTVSWSGGSAQITVGQAAESPAFCRIVTVTVGGQSTIGVTAAGGRFTAAITPEPGTPPGVCGPWTASASAGITFDGLTAGPGAPAGISFVVQPNAASAPRSMQLTISFGGSPSPTLTVNQEGKP